MNLEQALSEADQLLKRVCTSDVEVLNEAARHILDAGGKHVRPRLALLAYQAVGGQDLREVIPAAAAVELVHTATLVHDDINDHGSLRRGRPTVNAIWGRTFALLTGDFLFTKVYELMAPYGKLNEEFAAATVALVEGETLQAQAAKYNTLTREVYAKIIAKKTAILFQMAARVGAMLGKGTPEQVEALGQYGFKVGLAFQIVDDILDLIADSKKLGKDAGIDIAQGRGLAMAMATGSVGSINGNGHGNGNGHNTHGVAIMEAEPEPPAPVDPLEAFKRKMLTGGYVEEGREQAQQLSALGIADLAIFPPSPALDELKAFAEMVVNRDY
jgi:octaprenyl-diphosphate synthase